MCLEIYDIDPAKFVSFPGLAWQAALNQTEVKSDLLTDIDMLLMVEKRKYQRSSSHSIYQYEKPSNKYTKGYDKNKQSYVHYGNVNNLNRWAMSHKLSVSNFE